MLDTSRFDLSRLRSFTKWMHAGERVQAEEARSARVVCIASGKGGTGKSILASNLAVLRAKRGERVLLVDWDAGLANAHLLLGLSPRYDLGHILDDQVDAEGALVEGPEGIRLLSGGVGRHALANPTRRELDKLFKALLPLEQRFDLMIIDHGAGLQYSTVAHLAATSTLIVVTNHEVTALSDAYALYKRAHMVNPNLRTGVVVNRVPGETDAQGAWERFKAASLRFLGTAPEFIGWVPADEAVGRSVQVRVPVSLAEPESRAARAFANIASWGPIDHARTTSAFYDKARRALR
ncbi:MAG: AAA family ATPase [Planctomycetes bacterium]|nr:AAA family ATPase [Planctomycetota bacterium]